MRFLFAHPRYTKAPYFIGAIKGFRALRDALARRGHATRVVSYATVGHLRERDGAGPRPEVGAPCLLDSGPSSVRATVVPDNFFSEMMTGRVGGEPREDACPPNASAGARTEYDALVRAHEELLGQQVAEFRPDWVVVDNDATPRMFETALGVSPGKVILVVQNPHGLPCGPLAARPVAASRLAEAARIVVMSRFVQRYLAENCRVESIVQPYLAWAPPFPDLGCFDRNAVMMVNPCDFKGSGIFAELCESFPSTRFVAVRTWGPFDDRIARMANVRIIDAASSMDDVLRHASVLLVPSLWAEAFGMVAVDAMLRGIPVIGSNIGGLPEALLGVGDLVDVQPMTLPPGRQGLHERIVPAQDVSPWRAALRPLLCEEVHYVARSRASRRAALAYVDGLSVDPLLRSLG